MRKLSLFIITLLVLFGALGARPAQAQGEKFDVYLSGYIMNVAAVGQRAPINLWFVSTGGPDFTPTGTVTITPDGPAEGCAFDLMPGDTLGAGKGACDVTFNAPGEVYLLISYEGDDYNNGLEIVTAVTVIPAQTLRVRSNAVQDGWARGLYQGVSQTSAGFIAGSQAATPFSGVTINNTSTTFKVGDDEQNRSFAGILSFDTAALPDTARVLGFQMRLRVANSGNPVGDWMSWNNLWAKIRPGYFGSSPNLEKMDMGDDWTLPFNMPGSDYNGFSSSLMPEASGLRLWFYAVTNDTTINKAGVTQVRLLPGQYASDLDYSPDYLSMYTGNATRDYRPLLEVIYYVP